MSDRKQPLWLEKDGERRFYHGDDVEAALLNGWSKVEGNRSNGQPWNPEPEDGVISQQEAAAEVIKAGNEAKAKRDEKKAKERERAEKEAAKAQTDQPEKPDMKVQIVDPPKKK